MIKPYFGKDHLDEDEFWQLYEKFTIKLNDKEPKASQLLLEYDTLRRNLLFTQNVQFIIEEPEQNLFPETQRDLMYHLLQKCLTREGNRLTITTHSPYILYALNNCLLGGLIERQISDEAEKKDFLGNQFLSEKSWIDPQLVSVWEIENGTLRNIQDKDNIISKNYFDTQMTALTDEYLQILSYYKDEE